ncbi:MAG: hypothetical protein ACJ75B_07965 [Flavisolibacter sp.]
MKQIIFSTALALCLSAAASAQSTQKKSTQKKQVHTSTKKTTSQSTAPLDNRKNYEWKNGQKSTPTGAEATGINTDTYVSGKKDSASNKLRKVDHHH